MKKLIGIVIILALIAGAAFVVVKKKQQIANTPSVPSYPLPVKTARVNWSVLQVFSSYLGVLQPVTSFDLSSRISAHILSIGVREGDHVKKGQVLVMLDDRDLQDKLLAQKATLAALEAGITGTQSLLATQDAVFHRDAVLHQSGAISTEAFERSRAQRDSLRAQVEEAKRRIEAQKAVINATQVELSYTRLSSPMDAVVAKRLLEPGDLSVIGRPILHLEAENAFKVVVQVPQNQVSAFKVGYRVRLLNGAEVLEADISRIYPAVTNGTLGTVEIDLKSRAFGLPSGASVPVELITDTVEGLVVPLDALLLNTDRAFVYEVKNGRIHVVPVTIVAKNADFACIKGELTAGTQVVVADEGKLMRLTEGMEVLVTNSSSNQR
ncbi:MAG: efflux RND transporter periplasmic adaptor subunit [Dissulfuribacterales bacterium]